MELLLDFGCQKTLNVLVTTFHHSVIDIPHPQRVGDNEGQTKHTHEDIGGRKSYGKIAETDNYAWYDKSYQLNDNLYAVFEIALTRDFQLQRYALLVIDCQLEDDEMDKSGHQ